MEEKNIEIEKSNELVFNIVQQQLNNQIQNIDSLDSKSGIILGFTGAIIATINILNNDPFSILILFAIICLIVSILNNCRALYVAEWRLDPHPEALKKYYIDESKEKTQKQLIINIVESYNTNEITFKKKVNFLKDAIVFLALEL